MAPRLIGQMNGILFALGSRPVAGAMVGIQELESGGAWGAELPIHRAGPRTRSRVFRVIDPPARALEETSRQLAWLALAYGAADPNQGADVFAPLVVNRIGLISGRPSRSSKGVSTYFRVGQGMRLSGWGHPRRAIITRQAIDSGGKDGGGFRKPNGIEGCTPVRRSSVSPTFATRGQQSLKRSDFRGRGVARSAPQSGRSLCFGMPSFVILGCGCPGKLI
jgi:hypothetical protein